MEQRFSQEVSMFHEKFHSEVLHGNSDNLWFTHKEAMRWK